MLKQPTKLWMAALLAVLVALAAGCTTTAGTATAKAEADADWQFHSIADIGLIQANAVVPQPEGALIIDSRPYKPKYVNGHIPTAMNLPDSQFEALQGKLPRDLDTVLVFYCEGYT